MSNGSEDRRSEEHEDQAAPRDSMEFVREAPKSAGFPHHHGLADSPLMRHLEEMAREGAKHVT
jgi:hypothetical protein